jgi:putative methionine-R-sulfoxide reductase with GAF domain
LEYKTAEKQIKSITKNSSYVLLDIVDFLYNNFEHYTWIGIYIIQGKYLILGPWKGPNITEHTRIPIGKGICGSAAKTGKTEVVDDVHSDNRYLACFVSTKSEIVVPIKKEGKIIGEIDIDSDKIGAFSIKDKIFLEKIADMLAEHI